MPEQTPVPTNALGMTQGQTLGAAGLFNAYGQAQAQAAASINQQTGYLLQARDTLFLSGIRADMSEQYSAIQAGRTLKRAEMEAQNYTIAGNTLLKNMRATNASARARAAANGVVINEGSNLGIQNENIAATMRDVGIADLNALAARVLGFEDATAMIQSTGYQNTISRYSAKSQASQYEGAASAAQSTGGLLANATLVNAGIQAYGMA
jgi:hypothetical protein